MNKLFKSTALALAASSVALTAVPAAAQSRYGYDYGYQRNDRYVDRYDERYDDRYDGRREQQRRYQQQQQRRVYEEPVYQDTRVWQGRDGAHYCQKKDGTTGLIIGGAAGALLGREIDRRGDRTIGTVLGAAAGALLGQRVAQGTRCR
jgi:hypothetical protein